MGRKASIVGCSGKWPTPGASAPRLHVQPCGPVSWNLHHSRKYMRGPSLSGGSCCGNCHALHTRARSGTTAIVAQCVMQHLGYDPGRTRTCNLWFRGPTPYPLGHRASCSHRDPKTLTNRVFSGRSAMLAAAGRPIAVAVIAEITGGGWPCCRWYWRCRSLWTCLWPRRRSCRRRADGPGAPPSRMLTTLMTAPMSMSMAMAMMAAIVPSREVRGASGTGRGRALRAPLNSFGCCF